MSQRYFKCDAQTYETVRQSLDEAWGHGPESGTVTCVEPAATAPKTAGGQVLLAVLAEFCEYPAVAEMLPSLLASGSVEEITREAYWASMPVSDSPFPARP